jgi:hypothetical protein
MSTNQMLYAPTIHQTIARGDLQELKKVAAEAEAYLASHGNISAALEALKAEIAKMEAKH